MRVALSHLGALVVLVMAAGRAPAVAHAPAEIVAPATCMAVGDVQVCWGPRGVDVRPEVVPPGPASAGWRCAGEGRARRCVDRAQGAGPFVCVGDECRQRHPRLPDDGQWDCADLLGLVACRGGAAAAGVIPGPPEPGWSCGDRHGTPGERVCVDAAPDRPAGATRGWRCRYERTPRLERVCRRDVAAPPLGAACRARARGCADGLRCVADRCLPAAPRPTCWLDADCGPGARCVLTACTARRPA